MASVPSDRSCNAKWVKLHCKYYLLVESNNVKILITGDSLIASLTRYSNVREKYFVLFNTLDFGIEGEHTENVF